MGAKREVVRPAKGQRGDAGRESEVQRRVASMIVAMDEGIVRRAAEGPPPPSENIRQLNLLE